MKTRSDVGISSRVMAAFVVCGVVAATAAQAQPANDTAEAVTASLESPPLCGDIRSRAVIVQLEDGATYLLSNQQLTVMKRPSAVDSWESDHLNSGN